MDWRDGYDYICNVGHETLTSSIILEALWIRYYGYKWFSLKFWKKNFSDILIFLLKRSFQGIFSCFEVLIGSD